ncbi:MAG: hypothetical protein LBB88_04575 [Planctomycetaceae bacterium]|jgi:DNA transposition AAA+ family ATPase|nr:hypothetical protein [Planctomycetaceae bacterium]
MKNYNQKFLASAVESAQSNNALLKSTLTSTSISTCPQSDAIQTDISVDGQIYKGGKTMSQDVNVLALVKGEERYIFLYSDSSRAETLRTLGRYASNPDLSFTWYDAAVLSQKIRQESQQLAREQQQNDFYNQPRYNNNIYSTAAEEFE